MEIRESTFARFLANMSSVTNPAAAADTASVPCVTCRKRRVKVSSFPAPFSPFSVVLLPSPFPFFPSTVGYGSEI